MGGCATGPVVGTGPEVDRDLVRVIERGLSADQRLCRYEISVYSVERTVHLAGKVVSPADRARAERLATRSGAIAVNDELTLDASAGDSGRC